MLINKRILLAVTNDLTHDRRMFRICSSLAKTGAEVVLIGRRLNSSVSFSPHDFTGVRLKCIFNKGPLFYIEYNKRLFLYLLFHRFDIACACDLDTALAVRWACFLKKRKSVYDAHEFFTEVPELTGRPFVKRIWEWIGQATIPHFNLRYTVGEELAFLLGKKYNVKFEVIRNIAPNLASSVDLTPIHLRKNILLYQGALNVGRGLQECIKAMSSLDSWEFWLAGEGDITEQLKDLTKELGLDKRVKFLGWVHPDDLRSLLNQAKIGINVLEGGSLNYYYSLANKFFDYINAGLPAINMNYPEYKRVNDLYPCSILLDEVSSEQIVKAIQHLNQYPETLTALSAACREAAKEFTWENEANKLVSIYNRFDST